MLHIVNKRPIENMSCFYFRILNHFYDWYRTDQGINFWKALYHLYHQFKYEIRIKCIDFTNTLPWNQVMALIQPCYVSSSGSTFQLKVKVETGFSCMYVFSYFVKTVSLYYLGIYSKSHWFIRMFIILEWSFTGVIGICSLI